MTTKTKNKHVGNTKAHHNNAAHHNAAHQPAHSAKKAPAHKEHGALLTGALILMAGHGILATAAYHSMNTAPEVQRPWLIAMMVLHSMLNIVAAAGIYSWKKWGLYVYGVSTIIALVVGLLAVGMLSVFYMVLPLAILGWLLRTKWDYFE